jgi:type VI secretion system protein VasG
VPAVKFSHRYLPDRQLPDKAVSVLDTACARLAWGRTPRLRPSKTPTARSTTARRADAHSGAGSGLGADHAERLAEIAGQKKAAVEASLAELKERWEKERDLVGKIREVRGKLESARRRRRRLPDAPAEQAATPRSPRPEMPC